MDEDLCEITAVDPLANRYCALMRRYRLSYPIRPVKGFGERLLQAFPPESFDIVYSSNALDHARSPAVCMRQMSQVVRPGGIIYLEGFVRNGSREKWWGLHQHDLCLEQGQLIHYTREGHRTDLTCELPLECLDDRILLFAQRSINAFGYEMSAEIEPAANFQYWDWYIIVFRRL